MNPRTLAAGFFPALLLISCGDSPKPKAKEADKPPEPITGRQAFQKMFPAARIWARDAKPFQMESYNLTQVQSGKGTAPAWQVVFVSDMLRKSKPYTWSAAEAEGNLHLGTFAGLEDSWGGPSGQSTPFDVNAIRVDSDAAFETAMKQRDAIEFVKKYPGKPIKFVLELTRRFPDLTWRVLWGDSIGTADFSVYVDATTGDFLKVVR